MPGVLTKLAGLSLVFLPLTFSWAIVRYRLMDTDLIFKRGVAYTLATGLHAGRLLRRHCVDCGNGAPRIAARRPGVGTGHLFRGLRDALRSSSSAGFKAGWTGLSTAIATTTGRRWWSLGVDLSSETDLSALLDSIVERLPRTMLVARVAVFLAVERGTLRLAASHGLPAEAAAAQDLVGAGALDFGFLDFDRASDHTHIFFENAQQALHLPEEQRQTAALLDLNYYLPCRVQDGATTRTIAVIGLGRTIGGDFLVQRRRGTAGIAGQLHRHCACRTPAFTRALKKRSASLSG